MTRLSLFNSPFLLGFDDLERALDRVSKASSDGYPPYNIERIGEDGIRITLAVAGFSDDELSVTVENAQLVVRGKQEDDADRQFLHRGIAARQFQRSFLLAEGIEIEGAELDSGLLHIDLKRPEPEALSRSIEIRTSGKSAGKRPNLKAIDIEPEEKAS